MLSNFSNCTMEGIMNEYKKPYMILFNSITDALNAKDFESAKQILIHGQIAAEDAFINYEESEE